MSSLLFSVLLLLLVAMRCLAAEAQITQNLQVRLLNAVASYLRPGTPFEAKVIGCLQAACEPVLPPGSIVKGSVRAAHSVGLGIRRERASLELQFNSCHLPDGSEASCRADLVQIDNSREGVGRAGKIEGILAASHPHSWLSGVWFRPDDAFFPRSLIGLTGAGGMIYTHIFPNPIAASVIIGARLVLFRLPDPEVRLPAGTELELRVTGAPLASREDAAPVLEEFAEWSHRQPLEVKAKNGSLAQDIINVSFSGSAAQVIAAFSAAGWTLTDALTPRTLMRTYAAFASMSTYPNAPVSALTYEGRLPDLVFQKSFNSLAKRHHIRLWSAQGPNGPAWLGAATHDVAIGVDLSQAKFTHRIEMRIDREREKVVNDLSYAGCISGLSRLERPTAARRPADGGRIVTDGALAAVSLGACQAPADEGTGLPPLKRSMAMLGARRVILETRHYLIRGNAYYLAYRGARWGYSARRQAGIFDE